MIMEDLLNYFNRKDSKKIVDFFQKLDKKIELSKRDKKCIERDFQKIIMYYEIKHLEVDEILERLSLDNFNYRKRDKWYPLDMSSKIYPLSMQEEWMSMYRLSLYLIEDVNPIVLQVALLYTMNRFPLFRTGIHKGLFWNYLDEVNRYFKVVTEKNIPCAKMNISKGKTPLFRVLYYRNRISCEFFHVLTDAHGGMVFLSTLVNEYLRLLGVKVSYNDYVLKLDKPLKEEVLDAFRKVRCAKKNKLVSKKALQQDGRMTIVKPCQIIHYDLDFEKVSNLAHEKNITINELFLSFLFLVLSYSTSKKGNIKIQVPVNMRKYYDTKTLRNFSLYSIIEIKKEDIKSIDEVIKIVKKESKERINKEEMDALMNNSYQLVKNISFIPLFIKGPIAKFIFHFLGDKSSTTVLSNLGRYQLPKEMLEYVTKGDFVLGTSLSNKSLFSIITINNVLTFTISKFTENAALETNLYNIFKEYKLLIKVHGSEIYGKRN